MDTNGVGVIVGRFQVPELHEAHRKLIEEVCEKHDKVIILLGLSHLKATRENPLDFEARKQMIEQSFPHIILGYIKDMSSDELWSKRLDGIIDDLTTPKQKIMLYGGRDSFIAHYHGKHPTEELEPEVYVKFSGTEYRESIGNKRTKGSADFRAGVVWATQGGWPAAVPTVDIAIFNEDYSKILLAKKPHEDKWRLVGGFADPHSKRFEQDARREVQEEAHIEITDPKYVDSFLVDDWRYRSESSKIKTVLFKAKIQSGHPTPDDDIEELKWFDVPSNDKNVTNAWLVVERDVVPNHQRLITAAIDSIT